MNYDCGKDWKEPTEYLSQEAINICKENINEINKISTIMSKEELQNFLETKSYRFPNGNIVFDNNDFEKLDKSEFSNKLEVNEPDISD